MFMEEKMGLAELRQQNMSDSERLAFQQEVDKRSKSVAAAYVCLILGIHYGYLGKWGLQVLYVITGAGLFVWMILDLFRLSGIVRAHNEQVADTVALQIGAMRKG